MAGTGDFLADLEARAWQPKGARGLRSLGLYIGKGDQALEVAAARGELGVGEITAVWKERRGGRATPLLLAILHEGSAGETRADLCGPTGESPRVYQKLNAGQVEGLCREALAHPDRHAALDFLKQALPSLETELPGITNEGLVSLHDLLNGAPLRDDWKQAGNRAKNAVGKRGEELLTALGFTLERLDNLTSVLCSKERRTALAVVLNEGETPEAGQERFNRLSPVSYALKKADDQSLPWVVMVQGNRLRLYATGAEVGVGRRGRTETWIECQPPLLKDEHLAYLWLLYSADALVDGGSLQEILDDSRRFAGGIAERLRERIYAEVVPRLAQGIVKARKLNRPDTHELALTYEMALTVLFRLLFIAYAEDRDLLPYRSSENYSKRSLKAKAHELADLVMQSRDIAPGNEHWNETRALCDAIARGNPEWSVPAYDGALFSSDPAVSPAGAALAGIELENAHFEAALRHLLVIDTTEGVPGPVDFRSLGVREFGTIYEGLLEAELALAEGDLALGKKGAYQPAKPGDVAAVKRGEVYLHNRSGARKASGSYYTKSFAVEHLLDGALEPALNEHFARIKKLGDADAVDAFFDFRVADIAMGSGHFLVAAVDRIEKRMADFLAERPLPGIGRELGELRTAAKRELKRFEIEARIEDGPLLRRLIARRCIYGVDLNPLSVQLTRLSIWIHSFVPGLSLSFLDHKLVHGNSLVGVGTLDEVRDKLEEKSGSLIRIDLETLLGPARGPLEKLGRLNDTTPRDVEAARKAKAETEAVLAPARALFDLVAAGPISKDKQVADFKFESGGWQKIPDDLADWPEARKARSEIADLNPLHFPITFPEVFLREDRPGFDVILGNPPWEEVTVEEDAFWARYSPGLGGLKQADQEKEKARFRKERPDLVERYEAERSEKELLRNALVKSKIYPGMGGPGSSGDPDLYKAFCWRFWRLAARLSGRIGVVLPRSVLIAKGSEKFRRSLFEGAADLNIVTLVNNSGWVFDDVSSGYTISLVCIAHGTPGEKSVRILGPYRSPESFDTGIRRPVTEFSGQDILQWNESASLPMLPTEDSIDVFVQLIKAPRLSPPPRGEKAWRARPDREMDATLQKDLMVFDQQNNGGEHDTTQNSTPPRKRSS